MKYEHWDIKQRYPKNPIKAILKNRGVKDAESFFHPDYSLLQNPLNFPSMDRAVRRIKEARLKSQKIGIFMDYDADGICGGAIIYRALENDFSDIAWYVPLRSEGYGLTKGAIDHFTKQKIDLLLTVDCGVKNLSEIDYAYSKNIEVIVFDHHQLGEKLNDKSILVHPLSKNNNKLSFKSFSGGGVAFMFAKAYLKDSGQTRLPVSGRSADGQEKWFLDLAAISTVADMVLLKDDNRIIVYFGQKVIAKTRNIGLKALLDVSQINLEKISTYDIGFLIAPRINAAGRMGDPKKSFELLITKDKKKAHELAHELNEHNRVRQEDLANAQKKACNDVQKNGLSQNKIIVLKSKNWNEGILGLIAGRVDESFYRPTIVLKDEALMRGSARSVPGVDINELLSKVSKYLESWGGHNQAAGLSLKRESYETFYREIVRIASKIDEKLLQKKLFIDVLVDFKQVDMTLAQDLEKMGPFGYGNKTPIFACEKLTVESVRTVGKNSDHLKIEVCSGIKSCSCIVFNAFKNGIDLEKGDIIDLAFNVKINEFKGNKKVDLVIEDAKKIS